MSATRAQKYTSLSKRLSVRPLTLWTVNGIEEGGIVIKVTEGALSSPFAIEDDTLILRLRGSTAKALAAYIIKESASGRRTGQPKSGRPRKRKSN